MIKYVKIKRKKRKEDLFDCMIEEISRETIKSIKENTNLFRDWQQRTDSVKAEIAKDYKWLN